MEHLKYGNLSKSDRIKNIFANRVGKIAKKEIATICPDISTITIERTLASLLKDGFINKIGNGRSTAYIRNHDE